MMLGRQMHTVEQFVLEPIPLKVEVGVGKSKICVSKC
jgi:hypothetical protein